MAGDLFHWKGWNKVRLVIYSTKNLKSGMTGIYSIETFEIK